MTYWPEDQIICADTDALRTEDELLWLELRKQGIGGSEAAGVCGVTKYKTPYQVWLDKTGVYPNTFEGNERTYWGTVLEPIVAHHFAQEHPELVVEHCPVMLRARDYPWMIGNPDRLLWNADGEMGVLEVKTTGEWMAHEWDGDDLPLPAYFQTLHYAIVTGATFAWCACLIGGQTFVAREVPMDPDIIRELVDREHEFWHQNVLNGVAPRMMSADYETTSERWPEDNGEVVDLPDPARVWLRDYLAASEALKLAEEQKGAAGNEIRAALGDAKLGLLEDEPVVSWATTARGGRTLRVLKAGKKYA